MLMQPSERIAITARGGPCHKRHACVGSTTGPPRTANTPAGSLSAPRQISYAHRKAESKAHVAANVLGAGVGRLQPCTSAPQPRLLRSFMELLQCRPLAGEHRCLGPLRPSICCKARKAANDRGRAAHSAALQQPLQPRLPTCCTRSCVLPLGSRPLRQPPSGQDPHSLLRAVQAQQAGRQGVDQRERQE